MQISRTMFGRVVLDQVNFKTFRMLGIIIVSILHYGRIGSVHHHGTAAAPTYYSSLIG